MSKLVLLVLALSLTACSAVVPKRLDCDQITDPVLRAQIGKQFALENFTTWVSEAYRVSRESIQIVAAGTGEEISLYWKVDDLEYTAVINASGLDSAALRYDQLSAPTAAEVIACLGKPEQYSARYGLISEGGPQLNLDLLFPAQGVFAWGLRYFGMNTKQPPAITADFPINSLVFKQPSSVDKLARFLCWDATSDVCQQIVNSYKPWPGHWEAIEIGPQIQ